MCWGYNGWGAVGQAQSIAYLDTPSELGGGHIYSQLDAGTYHNVALK